MLRPYMKYTNLVRELSEYVLYWQELYWIPCSATVGIPNSYQFLWVHESVIINKKFWFIKWLLDKKKISTKWRLPWHDLVKEVTVIDRETNKPLCVKNQYEEEDQLIMYLSIQDDPLWFLNSIIE